MNTFDQNRTGVQFGNRGTKWCYNIYTLCIVHNDTATSPGSGADAGAGSGTVPGSDAMTTAISAVSGKARNADAKIPAVNAEST